MESVFHGRLTEQEVSPEREKEFVMDDKTQVRTGYGHQDPSEMRQFERNDFDTPVVFSDADINSHHSAVMHNFSDEGMYFESDQPLRLGEKIYVKTVNYCSVNKCEVRWCSKVDSDGKEMFGIGLHCEI